MRSESITLAGQEYSVAELPMRANAAWRKQLEATLDEGLALLDASRALELKKENWGDAVTIMRSAGLLLLRAPDSIADLVFAYAPTVAADRERVLNEGYESELMDALLACLRLAYPFGKALRLVGQLATMSGSAPTPAQTTSTS